MLRLSLIVLGFTSLIAQIITTRELMVSFYGNEFFIGWILFAWFIWIAAGCWFARWILLRWKGASSLIFCHLMVTGLLPLEILLIRLSRNFLITSPGQIPDLVPAMGASLLFVAPLCVILGLQFTLTFEYWKTQKNVKSGFVMGESYFWEALGFVLGGAAFNYQLVFFNEFQTSSMVAFINIVPAILLSLTWKPELSKRRWIGACTILFLLTLWCFKNATELNFQTLAFRFPNEQLLKTKNSIYGNLAVTRTKGQYNFYHNGLPSGTNSDDALNESLVHFPMLCALAPEKILLVGSGFNGDLREILKYHPSRVYYAQLNPDLIDFAKSYVSGQGLEDRRVILIKGDLRNYLGGLPKDFDVIMINLPNPSTAMINRYFTRDFFRQARAHLKPDGIFSTHITFSPDYMSFQLEDLGASLYKTLQSEFPSVTMLPEDNLLLIASSSPLIQNPRELIQRMKDRGIHNYFVTSPYIMYRYSADRIEKISSAFEANKSIKNSDLNPRAYYYNLIYWCSIFHQGLSGILQAAGRINYYVMIILWLFILALPFRSKGYLPQQLLTAMFIGGFSLMSAEMLVIYGFQVFYGNLYYKIATIICAVMLGMALGAYGGNGMRKASIVGVGWIHGLTGIFFTLCAVLLYMAIGSQSPISEWVWIFLALSIGILVGFEFSYLSRLVSNTQKTPSAAGIYIADLLGSCLGVLLTSIFLLPVYGIYKTLFFLALSNVIPGIGFYFSRRAVLL